MQSMVRLVCGLSLVLLFGVSVAKADMLVQYPAPESVSDARYRDLIEILQTALEKTAPSYGPYVLRPAPLVMTEKRQLISLEQGDPAINVVWSSTSEEKEARLLPIRVPLRKGLLGLRIALIHKDLQPRVDQIQSLESLRRLVVGQGLGWGDVQVYEANGIRVQQAPYSSLFRMVAAERFDLFPRGIAEVHEEYQRNKAALPELAIEQGLLIEYPWPYYFFFNRRDTLLAERVETGLRLMLKDGSFDAIFLKYNKEAILQANLGKRRKIRLVNPLLPKATPLNDVRLWFDLKRGY